MSNAAPSKHALRASGNEYARGKYEQIFSNSAFSDGSHDFPKFAFKELELGKILGKGGFGTVKEVRAFKIGKSVTSGRRRGSSSQPDPVADDNLESRQFIADHCIRNGGHARYAVKYLSPEVIDDPGLYIHGILDMNVETRFLSSLEHPNIIKMRAIADGDRFCETYFIVMDRLYDALEKRIATWRLIQERLNGGVGKFLTDRGGKKAKELVLERLIVAFDLSSALSYLHERKIIYRDIKPQNIGFDVRGDVKLFDFGLSTEVTKDTVKLSDGTYQLTGQTGSPRYMAPEVGNELPYNEKCDVYSMAIMLWQMLTCRTPYLTCTPSTMKDLVYSGDTRPYIPEDWSRVLKLLLRRGWTADIPSRFNMKNFEDTLKTEITHLRGGDASGLEHTRRRSTFVFRGGKIPKSSEFNI